MKKYIIRTASGENNWESEKKDNIEILSDFLEHYVGEVSLGFLISILEVGEPEEKEEFVLTSYVLANIGEYNMAKKLDDITEQIIDKLREEGDDF